MKNEGEFDFVYNIVDVLADDEQQKTEMQEAQASGEEAVATLRASREEKRNAWLSNLLDPSTVVNDGPLTVGPFTIEPANGVIVPGATTRITLNFVAEGY